MPPGRRCRDGCCCGCCVCQWRKARKRHRPDVHLSSCGKRPFLGSLPRRRRSHPGLPPRWRTSLTYLPDAYSVGNHQLPNSPTHQPLQHSQPSRLLLLLLFLFLLLPCIFNVDLDCNLCSHHSLPLSRIIPSLCRSTLRLPLHISPSPVHVLHLCCLLYPCFFHLQTLLPPHSLSHPQPQSLKPRYDKPDRSLPSMRVHYSTTAHLLATKTPWAPTVPTTYRT